MQLLLFSFVQVFQRGALVYQQGQSGVLGYCYSMINYLSNTFSCRLNMLAPTVTIYMRTSTARRDMYFCYVFKQCTIVMMKKSS